LILTKKGRSLIYRLSESKKDCLLLNFAIQRISDAGYEHEISSLRSASTYFPVYTNVLKMQLERLFSMDEVALQSALPQFCEMTNHTQHTYLYILYLLHVISRREGAEHMKRLIQELEKTVEDKGTIARRLGFLAMDLEKELSPELQTAFFAILGQKRTNGADINRIYEAYSEDEAPPPIQFLRRPVFLDIMIKDVFDPGVNIPSHHLKKYFFLIAYASIAPSNGEKVDEDELQEVMAVLEVSSPPQPIATIISYCKF